MSTSQKSENFSVQYIKADSSHLDQIKMLADKYSGTIGFFPYAAFDRHAANNHIIGCVSEEYGCVGYILFDVARNRAKITHLCVADEFRGQRIPARLLNYLKEITSNLQGIALSCRRDYNLSKFWSNLGFVAQGERPGKAKESSTLTEWRLNYGKPDLFSDFAERQSESKLCVVVDANIFFDLTNEEFSDDGSRESKALLADWLFSETKLFLTDEIFNEINRNENPKYREKFNQEVNRFALLRYDLDKISEISQNIRNLFPEIMKPSDESDLRQIAKTIAGSIDIPFFITRDNRLSEEVEEEVYQKFGLKIISPVEFIVQQDQLRRDYAYQPARLAGTSIRKSVISADQKDEVIKNFLMNEMGETKPSFRSKINLSLSDPSRFKSILITNAEGDYLALIVLDKLKEFDLKIPIIRFKSSKISLTLIRHLIFEIFTESSNENRNIICIEEEYLKETIADALREDKFIECNKSWIKICLSTCGTLDQIAETLSSVKLNSSDIQLNNHISKKISNFVEIISHSSSLDNSFVLDLERNLYPVKILDASIPTFIIPIQAVWAKELFDPEIANEYLWGAQEELALNRVGVYYRSNNRTCTWETPGRILWYVSQPTNKNSTVSVHSIRAVSFLDEITVGIPKDLYKKFRRLGVYTFQDVLDTAKGNLDKEIMAIKFSDTQLLKTPVKLHRIQSILERRTTFPAPLRINSTEFSMIYNEGMQNSVDSVG